MRVLTDIDTAATTARVTWWRSALGPSILFITAMVIGSLLGTMVAGAADALSPVVDPMILVVLTLLFIEVRVGGVRHLMRTPRIALLVLTVNFLVAPIVAFGLTSVLVADEALRLGVLIYCLFPCTDWFLGFTRAAGGDTATGAAIIPVSLVLQLALFPVYVSLLSGAVIDSTFSSIGSTMLTWFVLPAGIALLVRLALRALLTPERRDGVRAVAGQAVPFALAVMIVALFAANVTALLDDASLVGLVLLVVAAFFITMGLVGEGIARALRLPHAERSLLLVSISARNAPLMLALTALTLPGQPLIVAAIVVGMLLEFPHLTVLTAYLRRSRARRVKAEAR